jgi:hypothetical protein
MNNTQGGKGSHSPRKSPRDIGHSPIFVQENGGVDK